MPDIIITPSSGIIDFFPASTRVGRIEGSGNTINIVNPSGFVAVSGSGLSVNVSSPNATFHAYSATSGATLLNIEGTNGSLFSVIDNLSGTLMSVNNNAGLPVFEVFSDDRVVAGRFGQNDFIMTSGGNVGIGTGVPSSKFHVVGSVLFSSGLSVSGLITSNSGNFINSLTVNSTGVSISGHTHTSSDITNFNSSVSGLLTPYQLSLINPVTGTGTTSYLPKWTSSSGIGNSLIFDNGTSIGINTVNPSGKFHIESAVSNNSYVLLSNPNNVIKTHIGVGNSDSIPFLASTNNIQLASGTFGWGFFDRATDGFLNIQRRGGATSWVSVMTMDRTNGNIGIGTTTPEAKLHVAGDVLATGSFVAGSGSAGNPSFEFTGDPDTGLFSPAANTIALATSGVERLRINSIGNIGIGTSNPSHTLHVAGSGRMDLGLINTTSVFVPVGGTPGSNYARLTVNGAIYCADNNTAGNAIYSSGAISTWDSSQSAGNEWQQGVTAVLTFTDGESLTFVGGILTSFAGFSS